MSTTRLVFNLKASAATLALLCAVSSHDAMALPSELPESCTFIYPDGWRCCWTDGSCSELYPKTTAAPAATVAPTLPPAAVPAAPTALAPSPAGTTCPTSITSTVPGIGIPGFSHVLAGSGLFTTSHDTAALECGTDALGNVIPCPPNRVGEITKNCVLPGIDPPPMLRAYVAPNIRFPADPIPFIALPAIGTTVLAAGASMNTLSGSCNNPFMISATGDVVKNDDPSINSRIKCPVKKGVPGLPINSVTRPAPTPCPVGVLTCKDADAAPDPPGTTPVCNVPNSADGPVPNLGTGCSNVPTPGLTTVLPYCHKDLSGIPQTCPGGGCTEKIPGTSCGGAVPLIDPIPWDETDVMPSCPPDDWCITNPGTPKALRDGSLHVSQGTATPNIYNITIAMGQNNLYVGTTTRFYSIPGMGLCKQFFPGRAGGLVLSEGYSYLVVLPSVTEVVSGALCYGESCDYSGFADAPSFVTADYPIDYTTGTNPYRPYGVIYSTQPEPNPALPRSYIPSINLATGTQVYFSLSTAGSITLPEGGSFVTPTGGLVTIPRQGTIYAVGDGTTVNLGPGVGYLLDAGNMRVSTGPVCYVQLVPPLTGEQVVTCSGTLPPVPAPLPPGDPDAVVTVPNVSIPILTSSVALPENTPVPPFTIMEYANPCGNPPTVSLHGATIEPSWCPTPQMLDPTNGTCVLPKPICPGGTVVPYTGPLPPAPGDGLRCQSCGTYDCNVCSPAGEGRTTCIWTIGGCTSSGLYEPMECDLPGFIWCPVTQTCTYGVVGSNTAILCGTPTSTPAPAPPPPACTGTVGGDGDASCNGSNSTGP